MNDREFDALLESAAPELPPDDVARDVTPWRRAIGNILGGSAHVLHHSQPALR